MNTRNEKRLRKKRMEKIEKNARKGMNKLQSFVLDSLKDGSVTHEEVKEMCVHYLQEKIIEELALTITIDEARKHLETFGYTVIEAVSDQEEG